MTIRFEDIEKLFEFAKASQVILALLIRIPDCSTPHAQARQHAALWALSLLLSLSSCQHEH